MSDTPEGQIETTVETEFIDVDGDGTIDVIRETTTTVVDVDGDGTIDIVQQTVTTAYDLTGDGEADLVESTTVTGVDVDGDGEFSDGGIGIERTTAGPEEPLADADDGAGSGKGGWVGPATVRAVLKCPPHPYTRALLDALPSRRTTTNSPTNRPCQAFPTPPICFPTQASLWSRSGAG